MTSITLTSCVYRIAALAAVVLLSACQSNGMPPQTPSGSPQSLPQAITNEPQSATQLPGVIPSASLAGERFSTSNVTATCVDGMHIFPHDTFVASGTATGPYPGTFQASGFLFPTGLGPSLSEQFQIHSGSLTISGTATSSGINTTSCPANAFSVRGTYTALGTSGTTTVGYNKANTIKFLQTFGGSLPKPSVVQTASGATHAASASCTFAKTPTAGNVFVFGVGFYPSAVTITAPAGVTAINASNAQEHDYYRVVRAGDGRTWTFTGTGTPYINVICYEVTGEDVSHPIDAHGENHTTTQVQSTALVKPLTSGTLPIAFFGNGNRSAFSGLTSGWTNDINQISGYKQFGMHGPIASLSSVQASITLTGGSANGGTALVLVKP